MVTCRQYTGDQIYGDAHCDAPVTGFYRQCGNGAKTGCKVTIAYCVAHGGEARAESEMIAHHEIVHGVVYVPKEQP